VNPTTLEIVAAILFALAVLHTFCTKWFEHLAHTYPNHAGIWHLLGEVEVVFGFWALILALAMAFLEGTAAATHYLDTRSYTEPLFVFAIMVIAGTRPVMQAAVTLVAFLARLVPWPGRMAWFAVTLGVVPLLGSFITEPAAMTLAALMLSEHIFGHGASPRLRYAALGVLFVNISIGGTLTHFAAPPVLMVASPWGWDTLFMLQHFGWKAALAVFVNTIILTACFKTELGAMPPIKTVPERRQVPLTLIMVHLMLLGVVVVFAHHPPVFMGFFLLFLGLTHAYRHHHDRLLLREGLLVAFFLAGLVVLGGQQQWWLQPLLMNLSSDAVFFGAMGLTAITDNAALTYLGSLVSGLSEDFKYALVTGAVAGGGLTIIANAPNPAGVAILRRHFTENTIHPLGLLGAATIPSIVAALAFRYL